MVLTDLLTDTRKRWLKTLKLFKRRKSGSLTSPRHHRVSPTHSPVATRLPPFPVTPPDSVYENVSCADSAYDSDRSSGRWSHPGACYLQDSRDRDSDRSSVSTEMTWLEEDRETMQNDLNERIEMLNAL